MTACKPDTPAERVARSQAKRLATGAIRTPNGILPAEAAQALDKLHRTGYAPSATGCIARALVDAARK